VLKEEVIPCAPSIPFEPGQILFLVTDGIVEASSSRGDLFGSDRMMNTVLENRGKNGHEIIAALFETVRGFSGGVPQHDDQTVVIIKRLVATDPDPHHESAGTGRPCRHGRAGSEAEHPREAVVMRMCQSDTSPMPFDRVGNTQRDPLTTMRIWDHWRHGVRRNPVP
jgi:hypothetical protein